MENKNMDAVIRVRGLKKDFDKLAVLKGIDVDICKGDVVCVMALPAPVNPLFFAA